MCGRFQLSVKGKNISERFNVEVFDEMYKPSYNCAPFQKLPVISNLEPGILNFFKWGLIPFWAKSPAIGNKLINTRSETIADKPAFKNALMKRRCLVPANGFFEWRKNDKTPFRIYLKNEELFSMAGIWEGWKDAENSPLFSFSIITTSPNSLMKNLHDRMPVILPSKNEADWLNEQNENNLRKLLVPFASEKMKAYAISARVNSPANNSEEIIWPATEDGQQKLF